MARPQTSALPAPFKAPRVPFPGLLPLRALLRRELIRAMRSGRVYLLFLVAAAVLTLVAMVSYPAQDTLNPQTLGSTAGMLTFFFVISLMITAACVVPAIAATSLVSEREQDTYVLLTTTLLRASTLVIGKILNATGVFVLFTVGALPLLGVVFFMTGFEWQSVLLATAMLAIATVSTAALCLAISGRAKNSVHALFVAYAATILANGGLHVIFIIAVEWFVLRPFGMQTASALKAQWETTVGFALVTPRSIMLTLSALPSIGEMSIYFGYHSLLIVLGIARAAYNIRRWTVDQDIPTPKAPRQLWKRRRTIHDDAPYEGIPEGANPICAAERRYTQRTQSRPRLRRVLWTALPIFIALTVYLSNHQRAGLFWGNVSLVHPIAVAKSILRDWADAGTALLVRFPAPNSVRTWATRSVDSYVLFTMAIGLALLPITVAPRFARERERETLDMLRASLLTPRSVFYGKVKASFISLRPFLIGTAIGSFLFVPTVFAGGNFATIMHATITFLVGILFMSSLTTIVAVRARKVTNAVVAAFLLGLAHNLLIPYSLALTFFRLTNWGVWEAGLGTLAPFWSYMFHVMQRSYGSTWAMTMFVFALLTVLLLIVSTHLYIKDNE